MAFRLNPFTGNFDVAGSSVPLWAFNPFTGKLDRDGDTGGYVFNPFTGNLDSIAETPTPTGFSILWGNSNALEWSPGGYLDWEGSAPTAIIWSEAGSLNFGASENLTWG